MYLAPIPDFFVCENELTRLGVSREKEVLFLDGSVTYACDAQIHTVSFADELDERHSSYRINTALDLSNDMAKRLIDSSLQRLDWIRNSSQPNAAAIIFTKNKLHARQTADYISAKWGFNPMIIDDDTRDPTKLLANFQNGNQRVIIAIRMLLEGVNVKRTRVITHLTNVTARMSVIQMWTRGSRKENLSQTGPSYVFCLKDPELVNIAESMDSVIIRHLMSDDEPTAKVTNDSETARARSESSFEPVSAIAGEIVAVFRGQRTTAEELLIAEQYRKKNPIISEGLSDTQIAHIAIAHGAVAEPVRTLPEHAETYDEINQRLKKESHKLANKIAQRRDIHPKDVHQAWISSGGPRHEDATNEQLALKVEWLAKALDQSDGSNSTCF